MSEDRPPLGPNPLNLPVVSYSKVSTHKLCPKRYKLAYIDKLPKVEKPYSILGNFCHSVLQSFHEHFMKNSFDKETFKTVMSSCFKEQIEVYKKKKNIEKEQVQDAYVMMKDYLKYIYDEENFPNVLTVEQKIWENINDEFIFYGFIDRVQKDSDMLHIVDYKTTKKPVYLKDRTQIKLYGYFISLQNPEIDQVRTSYILLKHKMRYMTESYPKAELVKAKDDFVEAWNAVKEDKLFCPSARFDTCTICDFTDKCDEGIELMQRKKSFYGAEAKWG